MTKRTTGNAISRKQLKITLSGPHLDRSSADKLPPGTCSMKILKNPSSETEPRYWTIFLWLSLEWSLISSCNGCTSPPKDFKGISFTAMRTCERWSEWNGEWVGQSFPKNDSRTTRTKPKYRIHEDQTPITRYRVIVIALVDRETPPRLQKSFVHWQTRSIFTAQTSSALILKSLLISFQEKASHWFVFSSKRQKNFCWHQCPATMPSRLNSVVPRSWWFNVLGLFSFSSFYYPYVNMQMSFLIQGAGR